MIRSACLSLLLLAAGDPALAQDMAARVPLERVAELKTLGLIQSTLRGRVTAVDSGTIRLSLTRQGSSVQLPWNNVASLHWATERSHSRGALEGFINGALLGAGLFINGYPYDPFNIWTRQEERAMVRRLTQFAVGMTVGATAIGLAAGTRKWTQVPMPPTSGRAIVLDLHAQDEVRVESTSGRIVGRHAVAGDSLWLVTSEGPMTLPWRNVGDLQIRGGYNRARGVLYGSGIAFLATSVSQSFLRFTTAGWISNVVLGGVVGWRYLSPEGWVSLPQPHR